MFVSSRQNVTRCGPKLGQNWPNVVGVHRVKIGPNQRLADRGRIRANSADLGCEAKSCKFLTPFCAQLFFRNLAGAQLVDNCSLLGGWPELSWVRPNLDGFGRFWTEEVWTSSARLRTIRTSPSVLACADQNSPHPGYGRRFVAAGHVRAMSLCRTSDRFTGLQDCSVHSIRQIRVRMRRATRRPSSSLCRGCAPRSRHSANCASISGWVLLPGCALGMMTDGPNSGPRARGGGLVSIRKREALPREPPAGQLRRLLSELDRGLAWERRGVASGGRSTFRS